MRFLEQELFVMEIFSYNRTPKKFTWTKGIREKLMTLRPLIRPWNGRIKIRNKKQNGKINIDKKTFTKYRARNPRVKRIKHQKRIKEKQRVK